MRQIYKHVIILLCVIATSSSIKAQTDKFWSANTQSRDHINKAKAVARLSFPTEFRLFNLNIESLKQELFSVAGNAARHSTIISLPNAAGSLEQFEVFEASNFEPALQARFPQIRAYSGKGITDKTATLKLSISPQGIQTMVFRTDRENEFIEPYSRDQNVYTVYKSQRAKGNLPWTCTTQDQQTFSDLSSQVANTNRPLSSAGELKTMRLAQSCNGEYANYFGATSAADVALVLAAFNATLTRCNGVYEEDLALHLNLIANTTDVIYYNPATDPYTTLSNWNGQLQSTLTSIIGAANYDIGHMFGASGGGGNAGCIGCVCGAQKGSGITSPADGIPEGDNFDIDYVAHEVGHQLGGNHTFSFGLEGSGVNKEVGSGITIMGYAGITNQDVAPHSIDIFHEASIAQIQANLATKTCPITTNITAVNATPVVAPVSNYTIPISTPFALTGSATDANAGDVLTYCWEQNDNSTVQGNSSVASPAKTGGPNWLSFQPTTSPTRICPILPTILAGNFVTGPLPGGDAIANIEALSSVGRTLNFRLTVRDNSPYSSTAPVKVGQTAFTDMVVTVTNTSGPFMVTQPNTNVSWAGGSTQTITWDVTNTTAAPVSCANVKITLSTDGGLTFPTVISASTANDGTEAITIPSIASTTARIKIEAVGNIFFDISNTNFTITAAASGYTFNSVAPATITCGTQASANITLATTATGGFSTPIALTATGNPAGTTVSFSTNPLTPGNSTTVTLNNTNTLTAGSYDITITGIAGSVTQTSTLTFTVLPGTPPSITTQPTDVTVCTGAAATFTVVASGTVTYQWQVSTDGGTTWTNVGIGGTGASYTIPAVTTADNNNRYRVIVSTLCGSTTSNATTPAILTVNGSPAITAQPANATVCAGSNNTFSVTATGGSSYQWYVSTNGCTTTTPIAGATNPSFTLTGITIGMNNNSYSVIVSGPCGTPVTSQCVLLTVGNAPSITTQPGNVTACAGTNATFTVNASGSGITYQWQVSINGGTTWTDIAGETNATLIVAGVDASDNNNLYRAIVSSATCATPSNSNSATLTVNSLPSVTTQPISSTICAASNVTFTAAATGTGITYQWQVSTNGGTSFTNIAGATSATFTVTGAGAALDGNQYQVIVSGTCAPADTSNAVTLTVVGPVSITAQPTSTSVCAGSNAGFTVTASSSVTINYQWQVSTNGGVSFTNIAGETNATLSLAAVTAAQDGNVYQVLVSNNTCPTTVSSLAVTLNVNALPVITASANASNVCTGTPVVLTATGAGATGTYTWTPGGLSGSVITVNPTLSNPAVAETIIYTVTGTDANNCGSSSSVSVTANPLPVVTLTANPAPTSLLPGQTVTLTATVTPGTGFTFTWEKNGVVIPNFTGNTLTATVQDIGSYRVTATDANGFCSSRSDLLTLSDSVTNHVFIYPNPSNGVFTVTYYNVRRNSNQLNQQNITVFDSRGARVHTQTFDVNAGGYQLLNVNLRPIASGAYFVVLRDGYGNRIASERIFIH